MNNTENDISDSSKAIKQLQKDIIENLRTKLSYLKTKINKLKDSYAIIERSSSEEIAKARKKLQILKETNTVLKNNKKKLEEAIKRDLIEKQKMNEKYLQMGTELKDLLEINSFKNKTKNELIENLKIMNGKYLILKNKYETTDKQQAEINTNFRKYLGLDIVCIKENKLKIGFNNLEAECYFIIDFGEKECVIECVPEMNLEKQNFIFKEIGDFYKFIKIMRNEIKQKL